MQSLPARTLSPPRPAVAAPRGGSARARWRLRPNTQQDEREDAGEHPQEDLRAVLEHARPVHSKERAGLQPGGNSLPSPTPVGRPALAHGSPGSTSVESSGERTAPAQPSLLLSFSSRAPRWARPGCRRGLDGGPARPEQPSTSCPLGWLTRRHRARADSPSQGAPPNATQLEQPLRQRQARNDLPRRKPEHQALHASRLRVARSRASQSRSSHQREVKAATERLARRGRDRACGSAGAEGGELARLHEPHPRGGAPHSGHRVLQGPRGPARRAKPALARRHRVARGAGGPHLRRPRSGLPSRIHAAVTHSRSPDGFGRGKAPSRPPLLAERGFRPVFLARFATAITRTECWACTAGGGGSPTRKTRTCSKPWRPRSGRPWVGTEPALTSPSMRPWPDRRRRPLPRRKGSPAFSRASIGSSRHPSARCGGRAATAFGWTGA